MSGSSCGMLRGMAWVTLPTQRYGATSTARLCRRVPNRRRPEARQVFRLVINLKRAQHGIQASDAMLTAATWPHSEDPHAGP